MHTTSFGDANCAVFLFVYTWIPSDCMVVMSGIFRYTKTQKCCLLSFGYRSRGPQTLNWGVLGTPKPSTIFLQKVGNSSFLKLIVYGFSFVNRSHLNPFIKQNMPHRWGSPVSGLAPADAAQAVAQPAGSRGMRNLRQKNCPFVEASSFV